MSLYALGAGTSKKTQVVRGAVGGGIAGAVLGSIVMASHRLAGAGGGGLLGAAFGALAGLLGGQK